MRDVFRTTMTQTQADGTIKALNGVEIAVYLAGTTTPAPIFQRRTGNTNGPSPESGASSVGTNGLTTTASGAVEFWAPAGVFDIHVRDTVTPERIAKRGFDGTNPPIQWNSSPMDAGAVPTSVLAGDGGIKLNHQHAEVQRQQHQIGEVIDWWRPSSSVPIPVGFEICDGRSVTTHDFPGVSGTINLPDLRNKFIIGADPNKADGAGSVNGDGTAASGAQHPNAPGIGGTGGANASKDLRHSHQFGHTHGVPGVDHLHSGGTPDHLHTTGGLYTGATGGSGLVAAGNTADQIMRWTHNHGIGGNTGGSDRGLGFTVGGADRSLATTTNSQSTSTTDNGTAAAAADMRPAHIGLLKLMKVRRA